MAFASTVIYLSVAASEEVCNYEFAKKANFLFGSNTSDDFLWLGSV
jgi:hypothetical protein